MATSIDTCLMSEYLLITFLGVFVVYLFLARRNLGAAAAAAAAAAKSFQLCPTLYDPVAAHQAPLSLGFSRQEYWSGLPFPASTLVHILFKTSLPFAGPVHYFFLI